MTVQLLPNDDSLLEVLADIDGPGEPVLPPTTTPCPADSWSYATRSSAFDVQLCDALLLRAAGTPFEGGIFRMKLVLGQDFPASPPKGALRSAMALLQDCRETVAKRMPVHLCCPDAASP